MSFFSMVGIDYFMHTVPGHFRCFNIMPIKNIVPIQHCAYSTLCLCTCLLKTVMVVVNLAAQYMNVCIYTVSLAYFFIVTKATILRSVGIKSHMARLLLLHAGHYHSWDNRYITKHTVSDHAM